MKQLLARISLLATIILKVIPAILDALEAFEKHGETLNPKSRAKGDS